MEASWKRGLFIKYQLDEKDVTGVDEMMLN